MYRLVKKIESLSVYIIYYLYYGIKIEEGFNYKIIKHSSLLLLEQHHYLMIEDGWEIYTDVEADYSIAYCWYRRKTNKKQ